MRLPDGKLHAYFFDVEQGESIFFITPTGKKILIDGGPNMSTLEQIGKYMSFFDRSLDLVILTHPHTDHLTSLTEVLRRYEVKSVMLATTNYKLSRYQSFLNEIATQQIPLIIANPKKDIDLGDGVILDVIWPDNNYRNIRNKNNTSIVLRVLYKNQSFLLTGDIEQETENLILKGGADITANIIKVPHHGSKTSSSTGFLLAVSPSQAIISVGENNNLGLPSNEIINRYKSLNIPIKMTKNEGNILFKN